MNQAPADSGAPPERDVYTVSRLNLTAKGLLEAQLPLVWVEGEISNLARPASGHLYFSLKDSQSQVRCALFRGQRRTVACEPRDGMQVLVRARVTLYPERGDFQLVIHHLEEAGEGALRRAFEVLKARLAREGLFDTERKRPLPTLPRRIGVVTSPSGAAIRDILSTLRRRFPAVPVLLYPVPVQGAEAAPAIVQALSRAARRADCDVLILARGGGSLEDLWAFNEEIVARAVAGCKVPVICGVGHEIDYTIADLAADRRAPTPTAAAEMAVPDAATLSLGLKRQRNRLDRTMTDLLARLAQRIDGLGARIQHPARRLASLNQRLVDLRKRLHGAPQRRLQQLQLHRMVLVQRLQQNSPGLRLLRVGLQTESVRQRLHRAMTLRLERTATLVQTAATRLNDVSPLATLARGYAVVRTLPDHELLTDAGRTRPGDRIEAVLHKGRLLCTVSEREPD